MKDLLALEPSDLRALELAKCVILVFSSEDGLSIAAAKALLAQRGVSVGPVLADIAVEAAANGGEGAEQVLFHSLQALEAVEFTGALAGFETLYDSPQPQVRMRAAYGAGRLGSIDAVDRLLGLLEDEDEDVRYEASEAIWRLTGFDFEFEPYAPVEEERDNIVTLRNLWEAGRSSARVRDRVTLRGILQSLGTEGP
ncbi:MAG: HEAT repeat domain-containing protein [Planctomycetota bacterium]